MNFFVLEPQLIPRKPDGIYEVDHCYSDHRLTLRVPGVITNWPNIIHRLKMQSFVDHPLLETLFFPADFHGQINPQEYLRILLRLPIVRRSFLRIKMPQEHPQVTNSLLRIFLLNTNPILFLRFLRKLRRNICGFSCGSSYRISCGFFCRFDLFFV